MALSQIFKSISRFVHIFSGCFIVGTSFSNVMWTSRSSSDYLLSYLVFGLLLLVSGVVNVILIKPSAVMPAKNKKTWNYFVYGKAVA